MQKILKVVLFLLASTLVHAHVGSPDVFYEGNAGPYRLFVTVRLPQVIPGIAELQVRSASPDVESIEVVPLRLSGPGSNLPSVPDVAQRSKEDPQFFVSNLWLMEFGALQVRIKVSGARGKAELSVPVASFARQSLPMGQGLRLLGAFFLVFLTLSIVPVVGGIVRDSTVPPGEVPQAGNSRRSRNVMMAVLVVAIVILALNRTWWKSQAAAYASDVNSLKPPQVETTLVEGNRLVIRPAAQFSVPGSDDVRMEELLPDHGHLMHLFLIATPGMEKMWHLHPQRAEDNSFTERLPAMPAGRYQIFADIVDKDGYPWTMVGNLDLPEIAGPATLGDDSSWAGARLSTPSSDSRIAQLSGGGRMVWERREGPLNAGSPAGFRFRVEDKDGSPVRDLEPYMGMAVHAAVVSSDLSVFAHVHQNGSVSMAALDLAQAGLAARPADESSPTSMPMAMEHSHGALPPEVSFPYGFPHAGDYRIFVQIKRSGKPQTAAFDVHVQ